ncbi:MAG: Na-translocating system protein MpsB [Nocardioides sp.]|nr:Na-translocating system protein MpsB [Nocardioides sp.]
MLLALGAFPAAVIGDPWSWVWLAAGIPVGLHLDLVSVLLLGFVGLLGWVVAGYSLTNLRGREQAAPAGAALFVALASLLVTVSGASLVVVAAGWTVSGLAVSALVARSGTHLAPAAAGVMRRTLLLGDVFLWCGVMVGLLMLPSLERTRLHEADPGWATTMVAVLLLGACVTRTGLVPAHRWLPETAEAPSPVSALLHAGVVNGAGVLVLLAWPLFTAAPLALAGLLVLGAVSLVMGAWAGRVRADVKGRLACSTTTQMGYMCIQLGLGLPAAALMHLTGHGAYKSWLFLRAGGALSRNRAVVEPRPTTSRRRWRGVLLAAGLAVLVGLPAAIPLVTATGVTAVVPVALSVLAAGLAGHAVAGLDRVGRTVEGVVLTLTGLVAGLYAWGLLGGEKLLVTVFAPEPTWAPSIGAGLVVVVVASAITLAFGYRHLGAHPDSPLAMHLLPTALTPVRRRWSARSIAHLATEPGSPAGRVEETTVIAAVGTASKIVGPAWPLRNMVAANPLAGLESMSFDDALLIAQGAHQVTGRPSLSYFLDLFDSGRISTDHLSAALAEGHGDGDIGVEHDSVNGFIATSHALATIPDAVAPTSTQTRPVLRLCESLPPDRAAAVTALVDGHTALWAQRAWASTSAVYNTGNDTGHHTGPDLGPGVRAEPAGPWVRWRQAAAQPSYDHGSGIRGASAVVRALPADPAHALSLLAAWVGMPTERLVGYLIVTLASAPGWSGHAAWRARRREDLSPLVEWAALRMAHDVLFSHAFCESGSEPGHTPSPGVARENGQSTAAVAGLELLDQELLTAHTRVWQRSLEIGIENWLLTEVAEGSRSSDGAGRDESRPAGTTDTSTSTATFGRPASQSIWCIDVRSARVRRHLENLGDHHTYGYAGFFGAAVRHLDPDQISHECCPALIEPTFTAHEHPAPLHLRQVLHRTTTAVGRNPFGSLVIAEAGGALAALASTLTTLDPRVMRRIARSWTEDRTDTGSRTWIGRGKVTVSGSGLGSSTFTARPRPRLATDLTLADRVELAATALRTTGLTHHFAPVLLICAHGSSPENNAFATAYDCGACGGNDGSVNAVLLVDALNDPAVREQLAAQGLVLPHDTVAVAAVHDTTTEHIDLLDDDLSEPPAQTRQRLLEVVNDLRTAGRRAAGEQHLTLPARATRTARASRPLSRRAADWAEPTPEWGLAGNAAILIGPRRLTAGAQLRGRVFLHSYERDADPEGTILEQLLTAPLVVAQWINSQYYFSAVAPDTFGASDKTTHNVVGDVGVLKGAHGDLATGLPWQALFRHQPGTQPDSVSLAHEPVRLLAVVAADPAQILRLVTHHRVLNQLVGNQWVHLICLDRGRVLRLHHDLTWRRWQAPSPTELARSDHPRVARLPAPEPP